MRARTLLLVGLVGCGGSQKGATPTPAKAPGGTAAPAPAPPAEPTSPRYDNAAEFLPGDTAAVLGVDMRELTASALWRDFIVPSFIPADVAQGLDAIAQLCGIHLIDDVHWVVLGQPALDGVTTADQTYVMQVAWDQASLRACVDQLARNGAEFALDGGEGGGFRLSASGQTLHFAWLDAHTIFISGANDPVSLEQRLASARGQRVQPELAALLAQVDYRATGYFAMLGDRGGGKIELVGAWVAVDLGDTIHMLMGLRAPSEAKARALMEETGAMPAWAQSGPFAKLMARVKLRQSGADVLIEADVTTAEAVEMIKSLL